MTIIPGAPLNIYWQILLTDFTDGRGDGALEISPISWLGVGLAPAYPEVGEEAIHLSVKGLAVPHESAMVLSRTNKVLKILQDVSISALSIL